MEGASRGEDHPPGAVCIQGGIYQVIHHAHRVVHKALVCKGDRFPRCKGCGDAVRFRLIKPAGHQPPPRARRARKKGAGR